MVVPIRTTFATACNRRSRTCPEKHFSRLTETEPALLPVSSVPSLVNDGSPARRILLVISHDCHERDFLEELRDGTERKPKSVFELVFFDLEHATDVFVVFSLLDRLRSGDFSAVHLVPPAVTWSRVRHSSVPGQPPLRTRQEPLGASGLAPSQQHKVAQSSSEVETTCWFLEQALRCVTRQEQVLLKILVGQQQVAQRQSGVQSRCALSVPQ